MVNAQIMPYPLMFDPSQWSNKYSQFQNGPLPWPPQIAGNTFTGQGPMQPGDVGWPTDALGNPIQPPQGVTLNTTPAPAAAPAPQAAGNPNPNIPVPLTGADLGMGAGIGQLAQQAQAGMAARFPPGSNMNPAAAWAALGASPLEIAGIYGQMSPTIPGTNQPNPNYSQMIGNLMAGTANQAPAAPAAAAPAATPGSLTYPQYLSLLANPGKPASYGATVPQAPSAFEPASGQGTPISNFMANFTPASSGPASSFQQAFAAAMGPKYTAPSSGSGGAPSGSGGGGGRKRG